MRPWTMSRWRSGRPRCSPASSFGYVIQRGGFCLTRAISNAGADGRREHHARLRARPPRGHRRRARPARPSGWSTCRCAPSAGLPNVVGGLLFGVGMILSGGCSGSTWYRVGEGRRRRLGGAARLRHRRHRRDRGRARARPRPAAASELTIAGGAAPTLPVSLGLSAVDRDRRPRGGGRGVARARPARARAREVALAAHRRGGGRPDRGGLVELHASATARSASRSPSNTGHLLTYPLVGYPNRVTWSMVHAARRAGGRADSARHQRRLPLEASARLEPREDLRRRAPHGRGRAGRRRLQHHPGAHQLGDARAGSLLAFASMGAGACATLWALYLRK